MRISDWSSDVCSSDLIDQGISRGLAYAPYADLLWCETSTPNLDYARKFAEAIHRQFPGKMLAYNCSPSFNWKKNLDEATVAKFQRELGAMGYKRSEEHTSELQSLMRISYAGFCCTKKKRNRTPL